MGTDNSQPLCMKGRGCQGTGCGRGQAWRGDRTKSQIFLTSHLLARITARPATPQIPSKYAAGPPMPPAKPHSHPCRHGVHHTLGSHPRRRLHMPQGPNEAMHATHKKACHRQFSCSCNWIPEANTRKQKDQGRYLLENGERRQVYARPQSPNHALYGWRPSSWGKGGWTFHKLACRGPLSHIMVWLHTSVTPPCATSGLRGVQKCFSLAGS